MNGVSILDALLVWKARSKYGKGKRKAPVRVRTKTGKVVTELRTVGTKEETPSRKNKVKINHSADYYGTAGAREICHKFKENDPSVIEIMAEKMSEFITSKDNLIPIPSRSGNATSTLNLANAISKKTGAKVMDIIKGNERESLYAVKKRGDSTSTIDFGFRLTQKKPRNAVLIDGVYDTGTTVKNALKIIPSARTVVFAKTTGDNKKIPNPNNAGENANMDTPSFTRTLYSIDTKGKTRIWTVQVDNGKYRFTTGIEGGKLVTSKWTIAEEKNKGKKNYRNQVQQATFEGLAHITKQMKKGYGIDRKVAVSNKSDIFKPMLAKKYSDLKPTILKGLSKGEYVSQIKADGVRCLIDSGRAFSRENNEFSSVSHLDKLKNIAKKYNCTFDGELYNHAYFNDFGSISGMTRTQNKQAELQYWIFDCFFNDEPKLTYTERMKKLQNMKELQKEYGDTSFTDILNYPKNKRHVVIVPFSKVKNEKELDSLYFDDYLKDGFEGQMLKKDVPYENKRTSNLIKRKEFTDDEFVIMGAIEGKGNRSGTAGKLVFKLPNGKTFHADIMGSMEYRKKILNNINKLKGKKATVKFFHYTVDGIPRHPNVKAIRDYE